MSVQQSPGVQINEIDLTTIVPQVQTNITAFAGPFRWGPMLQRMLVDSETTLVQVFGKPTNYNPESFFSCASFLAYSDSLLVVRTGNTTSSNGSVGVLSAIGNTGAVANILNQMVINPTAYANLDGTFNANTLYVARYPGAIGNSLRVSVCDTATEWQQDINLASYGTTTTFSCATGSNTATIVVQAASVTASNTAAETLSSLFSVGDLVLVGNNLIGKYFEKVTVVQYDPVANNTGNTTTGTATITLSFQDSYKGHTNYSNTSILSRYWEFYNLVDSPPAQSQWVAQFGNVSANDELHLVVVDDKGQFTGVPGSVLEVYKNISRANDSKTIDGSTNWYKNVINQKSQYIWWANDRSGALSANSALIASASTTAPLNLVFNSGADGADEVNTTMADIATGYNLFASAEDVDIGLIIAGKGRGGTANGAMANYIIDNICEVRKDCVVFISVDKGFVVNNPNFEADGCVTFRNTLRSTSYGFLDSGYKYMYDRYNDLYRWIPLNGDMAGLAARTETTNDAWWSPAGYNRGVVKNIVQLAWNPRKAYRDQLYKNGINPVVTFQSQGTVLFGDKTLLAKPSAFDRINVRRLFIVLEKAIGEAAKFTLFEFNDDFTRAMFKNMVNPFLRQVKGRRGITDFLVVCDSTNNPGDVIDANEFVGDIYIKPARSINFIQLNFIAVPTGIAFSEVIGKFG